MRQKGVAEALVNEILADSEIDEESAAVNFARKKKIGPFRADEESRCVCRQKDLAAMIRAGFDYETAKQVIGGEFYEESI